MALSAELMAILACPKCKGSIESVEGGSFLACRNCRLRYPVVDGIPLMLIEDAEGYDDE
ncbi:MAG TPA: Trm112 family protein [Geobacteraceae bacterium]|nr:Trm112 family protein [Geobacteraceae bacterium]